MTTPPALTIHYFDASGEPTDDEARCTRATVTEGGRLRLEITYLDAEGNPTPHADAWQVGQTDYDGDGKATGHSPGIITVEGGVIPRQR